MISMIAPKYNEAVRRQENNFSILLLYSMSKKIINY
jgi:hypothetical protein